MTLQELEIIRYALLSKQLSAAGEALVIVTREIDQMTQDQLLSASKANPT